MKRVAFWNDQGGQGQTVLWLDRDENGVLWLADYDWRTPVEAADVDAEVAEWCEVTGTDPNDLQGIEL